MGRKGNQRLTQFVDDLVAAIVAELRGSLATPEDRGREVALQIAHRICGQYGRTQMYVPALMELQLTPRDEEIWAKYGSDTPTARRFTAARMRELSLEYQLTERHIYNIVSLMRTREAASRQMRLPGLDTDTTREGG